MFELKTKEVDYSKASLSELILCKMRVEMNIIEQQIKLKSLNPGTSEYQNISGGISDLEKIAEKINSAIREKDQTMLQ